MQNFIISQEYFNPVNKWKGKTSAKSIQPNQELPISRTLTAFNFILRQSYLGRIRSPSLS